MRRSIKIIVIFLTAISSYASVFPPGMSWKPQKLLDLESKKININPLHLLLHLSVPIFSEFRLKSEYEKYQHLYTSVVTLSEAYFATSKEDCELAESSYEKKKIVTNLRKESILVSRLVLHSELLHLQIENDEDLDENDKQDMLKICENQMQKGMKLFEEIDSWVREKEQIESEAILKKNALKEPQYLPQLQTREELASEKKSESVPSVIAAHVSTPFQMPSTPYGPLSSNSQLS